MNAYLDVFRAAPGFRSFWLGLVRVPGGGGNC